MGIGRPEEKHSRRATRVFRERDFHDAASWGFSENEKGCKHDPTTQGLATRASKKNATNQDRTQMSAIYIEYI